MECNKEEADRAKNIAEKKMESNDFIGARKVALMAQRLYSDLKDIYQLILVCDVHCAAQNKVNNGCEKDWYGILQVDPTVDEAAIKKQYRKLALLLHPDKNPFAGASDAFNFIGEAHKVLSDNKKRAAYDSKYKPFKTAQVPRRATQQGSRQSHPWFHKNVVNQQTEKPVMHTETVIKNDELTFWTVCPFCGIKYQYYKEILNKKLNCQSCKREFFASETTPPCGPNGFGSNKPENSSDQRTANHAYFEAVKLSKPTSFPSKMQDQRSLDPENLRTDPSEVNKERKKNDYFQKRKANSVNGNNESKQNSGFDSVKNPRRSARFMPQTAYDQNLNGDDEVLKPSKRSKLSQVDLVQEQTEGAADITKKHEEASCVNGNKASSTPEYYEYPIPDFNDFDELKLVGGFSPGQLWAVYDTLDGMPRFYALIKQVISPGFKVRITWLEPQADDQDKIKWLSVGLPTSCGKFRLGYTEDHEDRDMFSHLVNYERLDRSNVYTIYPKKGETWAIYKNWDLNWYSTLLDKTNYKFEFVEVLSDYDVDIGVRVAYLAKLTGFTSIFCRTMKEGRDSDVIRTEQLFIFSHKVPSFRMNGNEGQSVPVGSFELDPASLPVSLEGIEVLTNLNTETIEILKQDLNVPDPDFNNFDANRTQDKFKVGQIWAVYHDEDALPRSYCIIKRIDSPPNFGLYLQWLAPCVPSKDIIRWVDKKMSISCGNFRLVKKEALKYNTNAFSHEVKVDLIKENIYIIFPRKGDVWAIYKDWSKNLVHADLKNCKYEIIEVLDKNEIGVKVLYLERVRGLKSVFKPQTRGISTVTMVIPMAEVMRFSHQVPGVRLSEEKEGSLRGFWEIDTSALPSYLFSSN